MWLTGFDVPELDTIYIDKPLQKHNLIQTISRVNRKLEGKSKGLVVDYIGIKSQMNQHWQCIPALMPPTLKIFSNR